MNADESIAELAAAVAALGALPVPVPVGPEPLTAEREAEIREWVEAMGRKRDIRYYGSWQQHGELLGEIDRLRAQVAGLNESLSAAAERMRADRDRITDLEESPLAWADELDSKSLDNFLIALAAATEYEPLSGAVDEIHQLVRSFREAAQAQDEREPDVDGAGRTYESYYPERSVKASVFSPVASLREPEGEFYPFLHRDGRVSHDMPETGGTQ